MKNYGIILLIPMIWAVFVLDVILPIDLGFLGVQPRTLIGTTGIVMMPMLHADFNHLLNNTISLLILMPLLSSIDKRARSIVFQIIVFCGFLLWIVGRPATHIGASGLVYGLLVYIIVYGFGSGNFWHFILAMIVVALNMGSMIAGIIPQAVVSWEGHLCGGIAGWIIAWQNYNDDNAAPESCMRRTKLCNSSYDK